MSMNRPCATVRPCTLSQGGVDPCTVVVHVLEPATSSSEDDVTGATALMSGATTGEASAEESDMVNVDAVPSASRMPALEVVLPGVMESRLVPSAVISELTWAWAPSPNPTVRMTAAMPMRMPRTVRPDRSRWLQTPLRPVLMVSSQLTGCSPRSARRSRSGGRP